jgi:prevent-host-death family protein
MNSKAPNRSRTVAAGEFKARCLELMKDVQERREPLIVTKRGKPMVQLLPIDMPETRAFGALSGSVRYLGDIVGPDNDTWTEE